MPHFKDGPQIVQGQWVSDDLQFAAWPPFVDKMDARAYDKFLQSGQRKPEEDWEVHPVLAIRAYGGDFV
jgi:hypothetical protein